MARETKEPGYFIVVNRARLWLDPERFGKGTAAAPDGSNEQCEDCGASLSEAACTGALGGTVAKVKCACGTVYLVQEG